MNAEELKMIVDAITTLGMDGKEAFIWFMVIKYGLSWLLHLVLWPLAAFTAYKISTLIASSGSDQAHLRTIRSITHPQWSGYVDTSEAIAMASEITRLKGLDK